MNFPLLWRLVLAHVAADFPLQPDALIRAKRRGWGIPLHAAIFGVAAAMTLGEFAGKRIVIYSLVALTLYHGLVDWGKMELQKKLGRDSVWLFLGDQALHLASLAAVAFVFRLYRVAPAPAYLPLTLAIVAVWAVPIFVELVREELAKPGKFSRRPLGDRISKLGMVECTFLFGGTFQGGWFYLAFLILIPRLVLVLNGKKVGPQPVNWMLAVALGFTARLTF